MYRKIVTHIFTVFCDQVRSAYFLERDSTEKVSRFQIIGVIILMLQLEKLAQIRNFAQALPGERFNTLAAANVALITPIKKMSAADELHILKHLTLVAVHQTALMAPLIAPWQQCRWATL